MPDLLESEATIDEAENRIQADIKADIATLVAALERFQAFIAGLTITIKVG